jgi:hypothetical protein
MSISVWMKASGTVSCKSSEEGKKKIGKGRKLSSKFLTLHMGLWAFSPIFSVVKYFSI